MIVRFFCFVGFNGQKRGRGRKIGYEADCTKRALVLCSLPISVIVCPRFGTFNIPHENCIRCLKYEMLVNFHKGGLLGFLTGELVC